jgi:hypothetical protein
MMANLDRRAQEEHQAKRRKYDRLERKQLLAEHKLLLEEYSAQAISRRRYRKEYARISSCISKLDGEEPVRSSSPDWDETLMNQDKSGDCHDLNIYYHFQCIFQSFISYLSSFIFD